MKLRAYEIETFHMERRPQTEYVIVHAYTAEDALTVFRTEMERWGKNAPQVWGIRCAPEKPKPSRIKEDRR